MDREERSGRHRSLPTDERVETTSAVVLAVTGSDAERADELADAAANIAGPRYAAVRVLHVFPSATYEQTLDDLNCDTASPPGPDDLATRQTSVREVTSRLLDPARDYGMPVSVHGRVADDVAAGIVEFAEEVDAMGIVVGGRKRSPVGKAAVGSTVQAVLHDASCPVTFVRGE